MSYQSSLPKEFPLLVVLPEADLAKWVAILLAPDGQHVNGSSFAVTVDCSVGMRCLWLSQASHERLKAVEGWCSPCRT